MASQTVRRFRQWFWRPPRPHGEIIADRSVSSLELFYDLVYVAVIAQAGRHLAEHVSVQGIVEFAIVFALIWIAWINAAVVVGWLQPAPWLFALLLVAILSVLWFLAVSSFLRADAWGELESGAD